MEEPRHIKSIRQGLAFIVCTILIPILAAFYLGITAAWIASAVCIFLWLLFSNPVRLRTDRCSNRLIDFAKRKKVLSFSVITASGAIFCAILFGLAWLYAIRNPPPLPLTGTASTPRTPSARAEKPPANLRKGHPGGTKPPKANI